MGPWPNEPSNKHAFNPPSVWLPVPSNVLATTEYDDHDAMNILEDWVGNQTAAAIDAFAGYCALHAPLDIAALERELKLPAGSAARLLPDVLASAGWEINRRGERTWRVVPSQMLQIRIAGM